MYLFAAVTLGTALGGPVGAVIMVVVFLICWTVYKVSANRH